VAVNLILPVETGIIAHSGGGFASGYKLTKSVNYILTCAAAGDSVILPDVVIGQPVWVYNAGLYACDVYPVSVEIDNGTPSTAVRQQPGRWVCYTPVDALNYKSNDMASVSVSQGTSITTGVTCDAIRGIITTQAASAGASGATPNTFTVTCKYAEADSNIELTILSQAGTGNATARVNNRTRGAFDIVLSSFSAAALNGVIIIGFEIKN